ncbi:hypothetical protein SAMN05428962_3653 [Paenibacillus sp. BC26]|nr:hypothetical protein SAMN05428962_3653 [Paenibacillus sp. BC26]
MGTDAAGGTIWSDFGAKHHGSNEAYRLHAVSLAKQRSCHEKHFPLPQAGVKWSDFGAETQQQLFRI